MSACGKAVSLWILVFGLALGGCSTVKKSTGGDGDGDGDADSDEGGGDGDGDGDTDGGTDGGTMVKVEIRDEADKDPIGDDLSLLFSPAYSAYDGVHDFKLPAIVQGVREVEWSTNDPTMVDLAPDNSTGGILITTRKAGEVKIIARAGVLSGSLTLHITDATPEDWETGEQRYNNEIAFPPVPDGGIMFPDGGVPDGGMSPIMIPENISCVNCHGSAATALDVEHTPQQTGGYSDEELIQIFTMGMKPARAKFHTPFPIEIYENFHTWDATDAEKKGIVIYLRSLEPKSQGMLDFQGLSDAVGF